MTLEMNKADYDEHLVRAISKGRLQGITCERQGTNTMTIAAGDDIVKALDGLKGAGVEDIADTLGAYGVESLTPAALSHKALRAYNAWDD